MFPVLFMMDSDEESLELHDIEFMNEDAPDPMFDYVDPNLQSPLILAVIEDDTLRLQDNNNYNQGDTPLHVAVRQKKWEVFQLLIQHPDIRLDVQNFQGTTPLLLSSYLCQDEYSEELLKAGADASISDFRGNAVLHYLKNTKLAQLALQSGADLNALDPSDWTPLQKACYSANEELACMLLYYGADPNLGDPNRNPLTPALLFNQSNLVEHLYNLLFIPKECPLNLIIATMVSHSEFFGPIITQIEEVYRTYEIEDLSHLIVASDPNDFKVFFNRFPYLGFEIVEAYLYSSHVRQDFDQNLENLKLIVENNELIYELALNVHHENMYTPVVSDNALLFVFFTMSLGVPLPFSEFERVRNKFGRSSELFKILRHMDIVRNMLGDVCEWCFLFETSIHMINIITDDVSVVNCVSNHLKLHNFFATPFNINGNQYNNAYRWDNMKPIVPLLTELCREAARKHIIKTFSIKTLGMFLSLVQRLPIDPLSKRQLTYEQPLYNIV